MEMSTDDKCQYDKKLRPPEYLPSRISNNKNNLSKHNFFEHFFQISAYYSVFFFLFLIVFRVKLYQFFENSVPSTIILFKKKRNKNRTTDTPNNSYRKFTCISLRLKMKS